MTRTFRILFILLLVCALHVPHARAVSLPPVSEEAGTDTTILFRFVPGKRMFFSPFGGNDVSIRRAAALIGQHREAIEAGHAYVVVRGFCGSFGTRAANLAAAKNRTNQVKSWFITHHGMKEEYYRTRNSTYSYNGIKDVVALVDIEYAEGYEPPRPPVQPPVGADTVAIVPKDTLSALAGADTLAPVETAEVLEPAPVLETAGTVENMPVEREYVFTPWYLKSNLVYDAVLMPSLEVACRFNDRWSAAVEGNMAWWHNNGRHKYYQLATIIPEARYWFKPQGNRRGHYIGLFFGGGWYDLENGARGYKGEGILGGVSYGYMFPVGKYFAFEAGIGVGALHTWYEEYLPIDGHYVYQQSSRLNYFGPLKLKFALVWNIGRWAEKGGKR